MVALGLILLILGLLFSHVLFVIGLILLLVGLVLNFMPASGGGRRWRVW